MFSIGVLELFESLLGMVRLNPVEQDFEKTAMAIIGAKQELAAAKAALPAPAGSGFVPVVETPPVPSDASMADAVPGGEW